MTIVGALALGIAVGSLVLASRRASRVERWIGAVARSRWSPKNVVDRGLAMRAAGALCGAMAGAGVAWLVGGGPFPLIVGTYAGAIAPAYARDRAASRRRREAERACVTLVEWLCALLAAGRPIETGLARIAARRTGSALLDDALAGARRDYTLGVPLHVAIARAAASSGIRGLADLGARLERARDLGRGAAPLLEDLRDDLRAAERSRALRAASTVEGKLTLVMTLCYLPALALLVIVPLFLTLLSGLFD